MSARFDPESDFVVGISPQYWAYTRMLVIDVLNLKLKDGINWLQPPSSTSRISTPVSKCLLFGHIVYSAKRRDGSMVYILDDGTGMIDCVHWFSDSTQDPYQLPSLTDTLDYYGHNECFSVGETVRIFGKIECLASTTKTEMAHQGTLEIGSNHTSRYVVREIHVRIIERVEDYLVSEVNQWMDSCRLDPVSLHSCLDSLGPKIRSQIQNRSDLPAVDDDLSSWRIFGMNCNCQLPYMEDLLYCHCQCTAEPLDQSYRFRDALLRRLLSMQSQINKRLEFNYKEIRNDRQLRAMASKEIISEETMDNAMIDKLFLRTFRALRIDGIIALLNSNTDDYLLITRKEVLEPIVNRQFKNLKKSPDTAQVFMNRETMPFYISKIHNQRLLYIKRLLDQQKPKSSTDSKTNKG